MSTTSSKRKKANVNKKKPLDWELTLKVIGAILATGTLVIGALKFCDDRGKPLKERRTEVYTKLMSAAASFSEATSMDEADRARKEFRTIYKGQFNEVRDDIVGQAADRFSLALRAWENLHQSPKDDFTPPRNFVYEEPSHRRLIRFGKLSQELSDACRMSLEKH